MYYVCASTLTYLQCDLNKKDGGERKCVISAHGSCKVFPILNSKEYVLHVLKFNQ